MASSVSIVIPTWNGLDLLKQFLRSVIAAATHYSQQLRAPTEIIIVDDGSADQTSDWLLAQGFNESANQSALPNREAESTATTLRFIKNETNRGFGETCNRGFEAATAPLVLLLNNDVALAEDAIAPLVENFKDSTLFAAHCRVFELESGDECGTGKLGSFARGFIRVHRSFAPLNDAASLYSMFAGGGAAMFDREKFKSIGAFDPLLSPFYWEDVELSYRAWKRGYSIKYEPRSLARHRVSSTIGKLNRREVQIIQQRNRLIYHWIHLHDGRLLASHVAWVVLLAITAPIRLQPGFISSCAAALKLFKRIRARRSEEKSCARRTDRDLFEIFSKLEKRTDLFAYDDFRELQRLRKSGETASHGAGGES